MYIKLDEFLNGSLSFHELLTSLASMTVCTPTVRAWCGTLLLSPMKNLALASIVSTASVLTLVLEVRLEPGSLNAMCPSVPIPRQKHSGGLTLHVPKQTPLVYTYYL